MKVDPRALAGIERKIARAQQYLQTLYGEMEAWSDRQPWRLVDEVHDDGRKHFWRVRITEPIPIDWAVVLGEAIHNLRSALDQAVYWLTVDWTGDELALSSFPVYTQRANFYQRAKKTGTWSSSGGMYKIRGIGPGPQAFIEALQPYPQRHRRPYCLDLRLLHDLWNQDKHRLVHLWGLRFGDPQIRVHQRVAADCIVSIDRRLKHDNAIVLKVTCDPPHGEVPMHGQITGMLSIHGGKRAGGPSIGLLDMCRTAVDVIRKLMCSIGRQGHAINLTVWTAKEPPPFTHAIVP
jgi:hypothetical protein